MNNKKKSRYLAVKVYFNDTDKDIIKNVMKKFGIEKLGSFLKFCFYYWLYNNDKEYATELIKHDLKHLALKNENIEKLNDMIVQKLLEIEKRLEKLEKKEK